MVRDKARTGYFTSPKPDMEALARETRFTYGYVDGLRERSLAEKTLPFETLADLKKWGLSNVSNSPAYLAGFVAAYDDIDTETLPVLDNTGAFTDDHRLMMGMRVEDFVSKHS